MVLIDLGKLTKGRVRMLTGHPRGLEARSLYDLDNVAAEDWEMEIIAPDDLDTITPSFVQGFLARSIDQVGAEEFVRRLNIGALPRHLRQDIETGVRRLLLRRGVDSEGLLARLH